MSLPSLVNAVGQTNVGCRANRGSNSLDTWMCRVRRGVLSNTIAERASVQLRARSGADAFAEVSYIESGLLDPLSSFGE